MDYTRGHLGPTAIELSATADKHYLLPLPVRHERGEGWGEGFSSWANNPPFGPGSKKGCSAKCEAGASRRRRKRNSGVHCGRDVLPDSSSVGSITLADTISISFVRSQSCRSNWTVFNTDYPSNIDVTRSDKSFWLRKESK